MFIQFGSYFVNAVNIKYATINMDDLVGVNIYFIDSTQLSYFFNSRAERDTFMNSLLSNCEMTCNTTMSSANYKPVTVINPIAPSLSRMIDMEAAL